jgi:hypothetical protein
LRISEAPDNSAKMARRPVPADGSSTTSADVIADAEQNSREWQNARQRILDAADQVGSIWFARIAIMQALQRDRGNVVRRDFRPCFRKRSWSPEELTLLNKLVVAGASPGTAAEALNRTEETVRIKARMIGCPFPHRNEIKRRPKANRIVLVSSSDAT